MFKRISTIAFFISSCIVGLYSQNNTSSPYTRYGYGSLVDAGFGQNASMGGLSYGLRANKFSNPGNPASYTAIDSLNFRFEAGASLRFSSFSDNSGKQTKMNGNLEYLAIQFPAFRWLAFAAGVQPYSVVGYDFTSKEQQASSITGGTLASKYAYKGLGGITQIFMGTAVIPCRNLSVGANIGFNFGTINHSSMVSFDDSTAAYIPTLQEKRIRLYNFSLLLGAQYTLSLPNGQKMSLGAVFQPKFDFKAWTDQVVIASDTTLSVDSKDFSMPMTIGMGVVYNFSERFLVGMDYKYQAWSKVSYFGEKPFSDRNKISLGTEIQPNPNSKNYFERIFYRIGANYSNFYAKVNQQDLNEFGLSAGFGFPLKRGLNPTVVNAVFEYGNIGAATSNLIKEQYYKITINTTINERWFTKRKFE